MNKQQSFTEKLRQSSNFHFKQHTTGEVQFLFFKRFLLARKKSPFREEDWALGNNSIRFLIFLKSEIHKFFGNS